MKIIEIRNTPNGEVAYLFDGQRVMKVLVEDYTGGVSDYEDPPRRRIVTPPISEDIQFEEEIPQSPVRRPVGRPKTIIPANLAGVFKQPGTPGAAVEERRV